VAQARRRYHQIPGRYHAEKYVRFGWIDRHAELIGLSGIRLIQEVFNALIRRANDYTLKWIFVSHLRLAGSS
jgi:hypothetical protein